MFNIVWSPKAVRQLEKVKDRLMREKIFDAVDDLKAFPNCRNLKALKNHSSDYRLRIDRYRVLFSVEVGTQTIKIEEVKKRDEHTY